MATDVMQTERTKEVAQEVSKIQWWLMGGLLSLILLGGGWLLRDLGDRFTKLDAKHTAELATLHQTNVLRGERLAEAMTKITNLETRAANAERLLNEVIPRLPMVESQINGIDARLVRIDDKLERFLQLLQNPRRER
jgi:hypothetical protein